MELYIIGVLVTLVFFVIFDPKFNMTSVISCLLFPIFWIYFIGLVVKGDKD